MPVDYQKGKIYKIISEDKIYIGSTVEKLCSRFGGHKSKYKGYLKGIGEYTTSFELIKNNDCKIILIELYPCNSKEELLMREQYWIETIKCINKRKSYINEEEKKNYYINNKDYFFKKNKENYYNKRDERLKYSKDYRDKNKEEISLKQKEKIICECGCEIVKKQLNRHKQTIKHIKFITQSNNLNNEKK